MATIDRLDGGWWASLAGAPAVVPAAALVLALAAAERVAVTSVPLAAALLGAALAVSGWVRRTLVPVALGALVGWAGGGDGRPPYPERPTELVADLDGRWRRDAEGSSAWVLVRHYRQRLEVRGWPERLLLVLPPEAPPPSAGRLRVRGYVRRAPALAGPAPVAPAPWTLWVKSAVFVEPEQGGDHGWRAWSRGAAGRVDRALRAQGDSVGVQLARALVVGEGQALPESWLQGLRRTGLSHAISLSGLHVALVAALGLRLGAGLPGALRWSLATAAVVLYTLVGGTCPSLVRASAMAAVPVAAWAAGRRTGALNALAVVAAGLVLFQPRWVSDLGFQLTVLATAGLLWAGPRLAAAWPALPPRLAQSLAATLGAQLFTLPLVLATFRLATPWAPLWNLLAVPWLAVGLAGSLVFAGLALVVGERARLVLPALDLLAAPFGWPARLPPEGVWPIALPGWLAIIGAALAVWLLMKPRRAGWSAALCLAGALVMPETTGTPELHLLDVGQGDAILLRDGPRAVLVDGGGWRHGDIGSRVTVPALAALEIRRLDAIVLTHPDDDHCRGLAQLAGLIRVEELWMGPGWSPSECVRRLVTRPGVRLRPWQPRERRTIGRWSLEVLPSAGGTAGDNDRSLVVMATVGRRRALLTGDLEAVGERALLRAAPLEELSADVLKVGHHGSRTSSGNALLAAVQPRLALISAGYENRFGHPAPEILERLRRQGARVLRTDRDGWVRLRFPTNGRMEIATPAAPPARPGLLQ